MLSPLLESLPPSDAGARKYVVPAGGVIVTEADADLLGSDTLVAMIVIVPGDGTAGGAV